MILFMMSEENVALGLQRPWVMIGSDGEGRAAQGPYATGKPHPRNYGTCPRLLGHYVRDRGLLSLPEAIRKMTSLPAAKLGLGDRGRLEPGAVADVVVFDPATDRRHGDLRRAAPVSPRDSLGARQRRARGRRRPAHRQPSGARAGAMNPARCRADLPPIGPRRHLMELKWPAMVTVRRRRDQDLPHGGSATVLGRHELSLVCRAPARRRQARLLPDQIGAPGSPGSLDAAQAIGQPGELLARRGVRGRGGGVEAGRAAPTRLDVLSRRFASGSRVAYKVKVDDVVGNDMSASTLRPRPERKICRRSSRKWWTPSVRAVPLPGRVPLRKAVYAS